MRRSTVEGASGRGRANTQGDATSGNAINREADMKGPLYRVSMPFRASYTQHKTQLTPTAVMCGYHMPVAYQGGSTGISTSFER